MQTCRKEECGETTFAIRKALFTVLERVMVGPKFAKEGRLMIV